MRYAFDVDGTICTNRDNVRKDISEIKKNNKKIMGYGAPAKATTDLNFFGISNEIECIVEDNILKQGKDLPGIRIPISSKQSLIGKAKCLLVLAWNFFDLIKKNKINNKKAIQIFTKHGPLAFLPISTASTIFDK